MKRYNLELVNDYKPFNDLVEAENGKYVLHSEAQARISELEEALRDMYNGWRYIREVHGDLYGVGWDRAEQKAKAALEKQP